MTGTVPQCQGLSPIPVSATLGQDLEKGASPLMQSDSPCQKRRLGHDFEAIEVQTAGRRVNRGVTPQTQSLPAGTVL
jgi:hypothetical protein